MPDESRKILFFLDEAAHLGRCQALEDAVTLSRGMGIRLLFFFQSYGQLKAYGDKAAAILDNLDTKIFFGINAWDTAEFISKSIGEATIAVESRNRSRSQTLPTGSGAQPQQNGSVSTSDSVTSSEIARRLLKPEEVLTLPDGLALVFHRDMHVIPARLVRYYSDPEFRRRKAGSQRGLGLAGFAMSLLVLAAAVAFGLAAMRLPGPPHRPAAPGFRYRAVPPASSGGTPPSWQFDVVPERRYRPRPQAPRAGYGW